MGDQSTARVHCGWAVDLEVWVYRIPARDKMEPGPWEQKEGERQERYEEADKVYRSCVCDDESLGGGVRGRAGGRGERGAWSHAGLECMKVGG